MPEVSEYAAGTPAWVDLGTPDVDAAVAFYGGLFDWDVPESENAEQTGGYRIATLNGKPAAGMMPLMQEGQPTAWSTYVSVDDADAAAERAGNAGGQVVAPPMDVMELGRMSVFTDPTGAFIGVWQPKSFIGAEVRGEAGSIGWNELNTRDPDAAKAFYADVFGWEARPFESAEGPPYWTVHVGGDENGVGGIMDMRGQVPDEVPPHWLVYFAVDDADATAEKAKELGGGVAFGPQDIPDVGRFAVLHDPAGAMFAILKPNPRQDA
jgi:predicted enzyme related to lactoylglutathione lyase